MIDPINPITRKKAKIEVYTFLKVNIPISNRSRKMGWKWRYSIHKIGCTNDESWDVKLKDWDNLKINNPSKPMPHRLQDQKRYTARTQEPGPLHWSWSHGIWEVGAGPIREPQLPPEKSHLVRREEGKILIAAFPFLLPFILLLVPS